MCCRPHPDSPLVPAKVASPYLEREARLIALTRSLAAVSLVELEDPFRRAACYVAANLGNVGAAEDEEARRRSEFYWRRIRRSEGGLAAVAPIVPPPLAMELAN